MQKIASLFDVTSLFTGGFLAIIFKVFYDLLSKKLDHSIHIRKMIFERKIEAAEKSFSIHQSIQNHLLITRTAINSMIDVLTDIKSRWNEIEYIANQLAENGKRIQELYNSNINVIYLTELYFSTLDEALWSINDLQEMMLSTSMAVSKEQELVDFFELLGNKQFSEIELSQQNQFFILVNDYKGVLERYLQILEKNIKSIQHVSHVISKEMRLH
ncbi:hypothetical protein EP331_10415 [bacterium]|nr:MAG: hypothetical protein EP331_10415 [bacterium]